MSGALSQRQQEVLEWLASARYGQGSFGGGDLHAVRALERRGLAEPVGYGMRGYGITDAGRRLVAKQPHPDPVAPDQGESDG